MPLASSVITKKLPGNVGTCAHVLPTLDLLSSYSTDYNNASNKTDQRIMYSIIIYK